MRINKYFILLITCFLLLSTIPFSVYGAYEPIQESQTLSNKIKDQAFAQHLEKTDDQTQESVIIILEKPENWKSNLQQIKPNIQFQMDSRKLNEAKQSRLAEQSIFMKQHSIMKGEQFWLGNAIATTIPAGLVKKLIHDPRVSEITRNEAITLSPIEKEVELKGKTIATTKVQTEWGIEKIGAKDSWNTFGVSGKGIKVAVVDTGIDGSHPDLQGKVIAFADFIDGKYSGESYDDQGHGTHVAGIIAGNGYNGYKTGVAPEVQLLGAKVLDANGEGTYQGIYRGIQWSAENGANIINLSLGGTMSNVFDSLIDDLYQLNILPVVAAGNSGPEAGTVGSPGHHPLALTVGATDQDDVITDFSSRGPVSYNGEIIVKPDVSAPGYQITSTWLKGEYASLSGTSMATPHVAGAAALLMEQFPGVSLDDLKSMFYSSTLPIGKYQPNDQAGWGRINVYEAILSGLENGSVQGTVLDGETNQAINDATVTVVEKNLTFNSDSNGQFNLRLPEGEYTLKVEAFLYDPFEQKITVKKNENLTLQFLLTPQEAGSITARVVDVRNQPVPSVKVSIDTGNKLLNAFSDINGLVSFPKVPVGKWNLVTESYRITPITKEVLVENHKNSTETLVGYRTIATEAMLGYYVTQYVPLSSSADGSLILAGATSDPNESEDPTLFAFTDRGEYLWTGKFGDRISDVKVSSNGKRIAIAHFGRSVGGFENNFTPSEGNPSKPEEPGEKLPPAPWPLPSSGKEGDGLTILNKDGSIVSSIQAGDLSGEFSMSEDGSVIGYAHRLFRIWNTNGTLIMEEELESNASGISISGDGKTAVLTLMNGNVQVYTIQDKTVKLQKEFKATEEGWAWKASTNYDGSLIVVGDFTERLDYVGHIRAFTKEGQLKWAIPTNWHIDDVEMSKDGKIVVAGGWDGFVYSINAMTGKLVFKRQLQDLGTTLMSNKVRVTVNEDGSRIGASFERFNYTFVYDRNGNELAKQYTHIQPSDLIGYDNLTRLVIGGPTILSPGLMGPSEMAILDTPDGAYEDIGQMVTNRDLKKVGTMRYGDYGWNYNLDIDYLQREKKIRWVSQKPVDEMDVILQQTNGGPQTQIEGKGNAMMMFDKEGNPVFLNSAGTGNGRSRQHATSNYSMQIKNQSLNWWIHLNEKDKDINGVIRITRY